MSTPSYPFHGQPFARPHSNPRQWNGSPGAVQPFNFDEPTAMSQQPGSNIEGPDAIREGKQKARAAMAATGITSNASTPQRDSSSTPNGAAQNQNGPQLSRKRSRDGTQLPLNTSIPNDDSAESSQTHNDALLDRYMQRDMLFIAAKNDQLQRSQELIRSKELERDFYLGEVKQRRQMDPGTIFGPGYNGYGNRTTDGKAQIVYNSLRLPPKGRRARELRIPRKDNAQQAEQHEELVPVRLDIELDKLRLRDTFTWNLHEKLISQDVFTEYLLEDLKIPMENLPEISRQVRAEMQDQILNYYPHIIVEDGPLEHGMPYSDYKDDEMRIMVKLNITIGRITLIDQFEWDINNPLNSPEEFARQMAWENALSGEFTTAIAHSIREQSQLYTKSLFLTNHSFDGRPVDDPELRDSFLPGPLHSAFRPQMAQKDWTPYMYEMSEAELERTETSMMREHRAQKRQLNRRGGPALPDLKDRQRTVRSLLVHTVIPGAVETFETTGIPKARRAGRSSRRPGTRVNGDVDSDDLDSDESGADSPVPSMTTAGTARTRGMRGAASAAQIAMRQNLTRGGTPDSTLNTPINENRNRRSLLRDESIAADDSVETLIVKLKIGKARLKSWWDDYRAKKRASEYPLSGYASQPPPRNEIIPTPARPAIGTPILTPRTLQASRGTPLPNGHKRAASSARQVTYGPKGQVDVDHWPQLDDTPPPPPPWLTEGIETLRERYPESDFIPFMRSYAVDTATGDTIKTSIEPGATPPAGVKFQFLPRIKCNDCTQKTYTAQAGRVVEDFEVHLKNRGHRERVAERQRKQ
ncbi:SNF5-domain-containing protein [Acrodontium crateriforme]|uniref:SNF5-domain-containing protein n=1 Tax=Acrodontium crateriforme TaxID=150365 RepID=A0AAQ3M8I9_9PEZI|nr:SNF5-domain-containing protein [Acrodontium crateriforme]